MSIYSIIFKRQRLKSAQPGKFVIAMNSVDGSSGIERVKFLDFSRAQHLSLFLKIYNTQLNYWNFTFKKVEGNKMEFLLLMIVPVLCVSFVVWLCKKYDINIIPEDMRLSSKHMKFKMPNIKRVKKGKKIVWSAT
jgi:hypothetical protein